MFILSAENFYRLIKEQYLKQYTSFEKTRGRNKNKSTQLISYNDKLNLQKVAKQKL
jgi:hypothetical protein